MFTIIENYKNMFSSFIKNKFDDSRGPEGLMVDYSSNKEELNSSLDKNAFDGDELSDLNSIKKAIEDGKLDESELKVITSALNEKKIETNGETQKAIKEMANEMLSKGFSAMNETSYNGFKNLIEKNDPSKKLPNWKDIMVALDNEESSFGFGFDSSKDSSEDEDFHGVIVNENEIKVRYDTIGPADTFYFSHDLEFKGTGRTSEKGEEEDVESTGNVDSNLVKDNIEREEQRLAELKKLNDKKDLFKNEIKEYENYISENKDYIKTNYIKYDVSIVDDITDINEIILHSQELNNELDKIKSEVVKNQNIETDAAFDKVERENQDIFDKSDKLVVEKEAKFEAERLARVNGLISKYRGSEGEETIYEKNDEIKVLYDTTINIERKTTMEEMDAFEEAMNKAYEAEENKSVLEKTGDSIGEVFEDTGEYISEKYEQIKAWIEELFADNEELNSFVAENGETITVEYNPSSNAIEVNTTWLDSIADYDLGNVPSDIDSLEEAKAYVQEKLVEIKADYDRRIAESQVSEEPEEETHYYNAKHNWNNESGTKSQQEIAELNTDENIDDQVEKKYELNTIDIDENTLNQVKNIGEGEWSEIKVGEYKDKDGNVKDVIVKGGKDNIIDPVLELDGSATWSDIDVDLGEIKTMEDLKKKFEELMKKYNEDK